MTAQALADAFGVFLPTARDSIGAFRVAAQPVRETLHDGLLQKAAQRTGGASAHMPVGTTRSGPSFPLPVGWTPSGTSSMPVTVTRQLLRHALADTRAGVLGTTTAHRTPAFAAGVTPRLGATPAWGHGASAGVHSGASVVSATASVSGSVHSAVSRLTPAARQLARLVAAQVSAQKASKGSGMAATRAAAGDLSGTLFYSAADVSRSTLLPRADGRKQ